MGGAISAVFGDDDDDDYDELDEDQDVFEDITGWLYHHIFVCFFSSYE